MTDLFSFEQRQYPDRPGFKAHGTSEAAARAIEPKAKSIKERVLAALRRKPGTPDEVAGRLGISILSVRPRFSELVNKGLIEPTGVQRRNVSGVLAEEYRVVA